MITRIVMMAARKTKPPKMDKAMIPPVFRRALAFDPDLTDELSAISLSNGLCKLFLVVVIIGFLVLLVLVCFLKGVVALLVDSGIFEVVEVDGMMDVKGAEGSRLVDGLKFDVDIVLPTVTGGAIVVVLVVVTVVVDVVVTFLATLRKCEK